MNVLSLFDGMSCGQLALQRAGIKVDNYYACEIDKYAIQVAQKNFPNTMQLGDVQDMKIPNYREGSIDLLMGGSPCQGFPLQVDNLHLMTLVANYSLSLLESKRSYNPSISYLRMSR